MGEKLRRIGERESFRIFMVVNYVQPTPQKNMFSRVHIYSVCPCDIIVRVAFYKYFVLNIVFEGLHQVYLKLVYR